MVFCRFQSNWTDDQSILTYLKRENPKIITPQTFSDVRWPDLLMIICKIETLIQKRNGINCSKTCVHKKPTNPLKRGMGINVNLEYIVKSADWVNE